MSGERRTRANGRASRQAILAAAAEVFSENGYRGTSLSEIASRVNMTQPGLLHHFRTKDALLLAVVQDHEENAATTHSVTERLASDDFRLVEHLEELAAVNARARRTQLLLTTLSAESIPRDHPLHQYFVDRYRRFRRGLAQLLAEAQERGTIRQDVDVNAVSREIIATLDGLHLQWLLDPRETSLKKVLRTYATRIEAELAPRGSVSE